MSFWKWLTTPSKEQMIAKRADEIIPRITKEIDEMAATTNLDYIQKATTIIGKANQILMDEFGLSEQVAYEAVQRAMQKARLGF